MRALIMLALLAIAVYLFARAYEIIRSARKERMKQLEIDRLARSGSDLRADFESWKDGRR